MAKQKLIENSWITRGGYSRRKMELTEAESSFLYEGVNYKALAVYTFGFTRPNKKNINGRIYGYELWDKVIAFWQGRSTLGLMDHPENGPGSPKDIWCVWRNIRYNEDKSLVVADCYIIDNEWGRTALGTLEAGGEVGLSSSGWGDFLPDGITVDPESFELERVADWVLEPSYEVFGTIADKVETGSVQEKITEAAKPQLKESAMKTELREKRSLESSLKMIYEDVSQIQDPAERKARALESLTFYEGTDVSLYKEDFTKLVENAAKEIQTLLENGSKLPEVQKKVEESSKALTKSERQISELTESLAEITRKYDEAVTLLDEAAAVHKETVSLLESEKADKVNFVSKASYEELKKYAENAVSKYVSLKKEAGVLQEQNTVLSGRVKALTEAEESRAKASKIRESQERRRVQESQLAEQRRNALIEAQETKKFEESVSPIVLGYYRDTVEADPRFVEYRTAILSKRTLLEAQTLVLKLRGKLDESSQSFQESDLSNPIESRFEDKLGNRPVAYHKGFL